MTLRTLITRIAQIRQIARNKIRFRLRRSPQLNGCAARFVEDDLTELQAFGIPKVDQKSQVVMTGPEVPKDLPDNVRM